MTQSFIHEGTYAPDGNSMFYSELFSGKCPEYDTMSQYKLLYCVRNLGKFAIRFLMYIIVAYC